MTVHTTYGTARISCGGKPLEGPYLPPASDLAELGRYLARKYSAKEITEPIRDTNPEEEGA